jgi:FkbM family methyltransferase
MSLNSLLVSGRTSSLLENQIEKWVFAAQGSTFCRRLELANRLWWRMPISVSWDSENDLYEVRDHHATGRASNGPGGIKIARRERVFRYRRGVADRVRRLARKYFIDRISFETRDVVIDCGANVGEIGLYLRSKADVSILAIEPSELEAKACDENVFGGSSNTQRRALWHSTGTLKFYDSNITGDSSLIEPVTYSGETTVHTTTLDQVAGQIEKDRWIKLLKIEGEGAEPEILAGAKGMINRVIHCTIDCGPERGTTEAHVIPQVCNFMYDAKFELLDVDLQRQIYWFRNRDLPSGAVTPTLNSGCCAIDPRCAPSPIAATGFQPRALSD